MVFASSDTMSHVSTTRGNFNMSLAPRKSDRRKAQEHQNAEFETFDRGQFRIAPFVPLNAKQDLLFKSILKNPFSMSIGPAGTAKSFTAASAAVYLLVKGEIDSIVITRNPVPTGYTTGFKPGTSEEKMLAWLTPILDNLRKACVGPTGNDGFFKYLLKNKKIEMVELESLKGINFDRKFIILEEGQEATMEQLKNFSTRIGQDSWGYIDGDIAQGNDRLKGSKDFHEFIKSIQMMNSKLDAGTISMSQKDIDEWGFLRIPVIEFDKNDSVRSGHCRWMLEMFEIAGL